MTPRNDILALFNKQKSESPPLFSGLISVTESGLESEGLRFHETHRDAVRMARAAASSYRVSGFGSAVLPLDMYVEAEALGATVDFREEAEGAEHARVIEFLYDSVEKFATESQSHREINKSLSLGTPRPSWSGRGDSVAKKGRIPLVCEAIKLLKEDVGNEIAIGAFIPGPFTLLSLLVETMDLYTTAQAGDHPPGAGDHDGRVNGRRKSLS